LNIKVLPGWIVKMLESRKKDPVPVQIQPSGATL